MQGENKGRKKGIFSLDDIISSETKQEETPEEKRQEPKKNDPPKKNNVFDLGDVEVGKISEKEEIISPNPSDMDKTKENLIGEDVKGWLEGVMGSTPPSMAKMMDDVTNKMASYVAYVLVQRLSQLNSLVGHLDVLEKRIFSEERLQQKRSVNSYKDDYKLLSQTFQNMLEFTRKFASQSGDLIKDSERDEVMQMLRSLDVNALKDLKGIIKDKIRKSSDSGSLKRKNTEE